MYEISSPTIIVIPPNVYHKTEGGTFTRYNIIVSPNDLNPYQQKTLNDLKLLVIKLNEGERTFVNKQKSIREISAECVFSSPNYFGMIFKKMRRFRRRDTEISKDNNGSAFKFSNTEFQVKV